MKKLLHNLLLTSIILIAVYVIAILILKWFDLRFRGWVNLTFIGLIGLSFAIGLFQLLAKTKNKIFQILICIVIVLGAIDFLSPISISRTLIMNSPARDEVVSFDNHKLVAYRYTDLFDSYCELYDYKNIFVAGDNCRVCGYGYYEKEDGNVIVYDECNEFEHL